MSENKVGRPTVMTDDVLGKLEMFFAKGLSDREACLFSLRDNKQQPLR